jgi:hypothetical protein
VPNHHVFGKGEPHPDDRARYTEEKGDFVQRIRRGAP